MKKQYRKVEKKVEKPKYKEIKPIKRKVLKKKNIDPTKKYD